MNEKLELSLKNYSVSSGTMRPEDLIPEFIDVLRVIAMDDTNVSILETLKVIEAEAETEGYYDTENAQYDLDYLFDTMNVYAPEGFYFGSHPGNGSDYGFWECEEEG